MSELRDLYQEVILDHNRKPRNFRSLAQPTRRAEGFNPLCGDNVAVELELAGDVIQDIAFRGSGCAISKAFSGASAHTARSSDRLLGCRERVEPVLSGFAPSSSGALWFRSWPRTLVEAV